MFRRIPVTLSASDGANNRITDAEAIVQQNTQPRHFAYKPNLIVVDGGKPQVEAAAKALQDCGVDDVAVCGLAKRLEEVWVPGDDYPIILKRQSEGMYLLQRVRDESHRFAITYHRKTRRKGALRSALDDIPGVGEVYQKKLLRAFGSVKRMREADIEDLKAVNGIGEAKAEAIFNALHPKGSPDHPESNDNSDEDSSQASKASIENQPENVTKITRSPPRKEPPHDDASSTCVRRNSNPH